VAQSPEWVRDRARDDAFPKIKSRVAGTRLAAEKLGLWSRTERAVVPHRAPAGGLRGFFRDAQ
jgi:hypothetical protein